MSSASVLMMDSEATWRGGEGQVLLLMRGLCDAGIRVGLASPPGSAIAERSRSLPVAQHPVDMRGIPLGAARTIYRIVKSHEYRVLHAHASRAHTVMAVAFPRGGVGVPLRVVSRRVDFEVARHPLSTLKYRYGVDVYLAISEGVRAVLERGGVPSGLIRLARSGIDLGKFDGVAPADTLRGRFGIPDDAFLVGNVAALAPHKSQVDLVCAMAGLRGEAEDVYCVIVGEGDQRGALEDAIAREGVADRVFLTGFRADVLEVLLALDCFVLSSYLEGLGTSIMDAQLAGIPVVATNTGGIPELVEDGVTGLLVAPRDPVALGAAILRLRRDPVLRKQCVGASLAKTAEYDYRQMVYKTIDAYREFSGEGFLPNSGKGSKDVA